MLAPLFSVGALLTSVAALAVVGPPAADPASPPMTEIRFMTLDPGHFHAALVLKEMYPGVSKKVDVYAPLGADLVDHLARVARFNTRGERPTSWEVEVHTGPDFLARMQKERPGNVAVISGRNRGKVDRIQASLDAGLHALVDKPWILETADLPKLDAVLATAESRKLVALDIMTERFEVTTALQRELVNDPAIAGAILPGTEAEPAVYMESVHFLMKTVAGVPNMRPAWFFDTEQQGEGLNDIGTHLVDLVQWTLYPGQAIDYRKDTRVLAAQRWPTMIPRADFQRVTGEGFPSFLNPRVEEGGLEYFCNTLVSYTLRDVHVRLNVIWDWEPPPGGGDTHFAFYRGSRSKVEVRQGTTEKYRPELYVVPNRPADKAAVLEALSKKIGSLQGAYPGISVADQGPEIRIAIPDALRVTHEQHFSQVTQHFLQYLRDRGTLPAWERPNMLAKYYVTTEGVRLARQAPPRPAPRIAPK
jgi:predicted dehydrogenase